MGKWKSIKSTYCEVCGALGGGVTREGWGTCGDCYDVPKPDHPLFDRVTGEPLEGWKPNDWRKQIWDDDEALYPLPSWDDQ
jgi:hypothetical protein